jgi:hypothetical protein
MTVDRAIRYKGSYQGAMVLGQRLEDQGVHVELPRKDRKRLEQAQRRLEEWQVLMERAELVERQDREQRELLQRLNQEPRELRTQLLPELRELDRRHNREREDMGLPPRGWEAEPLGAEPAPLVSLRQMLSADLDQVGIRLMCTGTAAAIAETVEEFREVAPGCEVEVQGEPHTAGTAPLVSLRRVFGADLGQVSLRSTGAAAAVTGTMKKSRKAARDSRVEVQAEPYTANGDNPVPPQPRSALAPPVLPPSARCTGTTRAGARCKLEAGHDGLCLFQRVLVTWQPCSCPGAQTLHPDQAIWGHFRVACRAPGCWAVWYDPPHEPGASGPRAI